MTRRLKFSAGSWLSRAATGQGIQPLRQFVLVGVLAVAVLAIWHWVAPKASPINQTLRRPGVPARLAPGLAVTMDPALFRGQVAEGYRVARELPGLLQQMPCYCGCYLTEGHENNLACFRGRHAESCEMCLQIALTAAQLKKTGNSVMDIRRLIDHRFGPWQP